MDPSRIVASARLLNATYATNPSTPPIESPSPPPTMPSEKLPLPQTAPLSTPLPIPSTYSPPSSSSSPSFPLTSHIPLESPTATVHVSSDLTRIQCRQPVWKRMSAREAPVAKTGGGRGKPGVSVKLDSGLAEILVTGPLIPPANAWLPDYGDPAHVKNGDELPEYITPPREVTENGFLSGKVVLRIPKPMSDVKAVVVRLLGLLEVDTFSIVSARLGSDAEPIIRKTLSVENVVARLNVGDVLEAGEHTYPFVAEVPGSSPSSSQVPFLFVNYSIDAVVLRGDGSYLVSPVEPFHVLRVRRFDPAPGQEVVRIDEARASASGRGGILRLQRSNVFLNGGLAVPGSEGDGRRTRSVSPFRAMVEQVTNVFSVKSRNSSAQALVAGTRVQGGREVERQVVETATSAGHITGMGSAVQVYAPPAPVVVVSDENEAAEVLFTPPSSSPQTPVLAVRHDSGFYTPPVDKEATTPSAIPSRAEPENMSNASASTRSSSSTLTNEVTTPEPQTPTLTPTLPITESRTSSRSTSPTPSITRSRSRTLSPVRVRRNRLESLYESIEDNVPHVPYRSTFSGTTEDGVVTWECTLLPAVPADATEVAVDLVLRCMRADTDFESGIKKVENLYAFLKEVTVFKVVILTRTGRTQTRKIPEERVRGKLTVKPPFVEMEPSPTMPDTEDIRLRLKIPIISNPTFLNGTNPYAIQTAIYTNHTNKSLNLLPDLIEKEVERHHHIRISIPYVVRKRPDVSSFDWYKRNRTVEICVPFKVVVLAKGAKFPWDMVNAVRIPPRIVERRNVEDEAPPYSTAVRASSSLGFSRQDEMMFDPLPLTRSESYQI